MNVSGLYEFVHVSMFNGLIAKSFNLTFDDYISKKKFRTTWQILAKYPVGTYLIPTKKSQVSTEVQLTCNKMHVSSSDPLTNPFQHKVDCIRNNQYTCSGAGLHTFL